MAPNEKIANNASTDSNSSYFQPSKESIDTIPARSVWPNIVTTDFKTKNGSQAKVYRTNEFNNFPAIKLAAVAFHGSALAFFQGIAAVGAFCYFCPAWLSVSALSLYSAHVIFSSAHHTGSMASDWYRKCAMAFAGFEYFNFALSIENDVVLTPEKPHIFGVHPHGIYGFGQVMWMSTRDSNPFYRLFPYLVNRCQASLIIFKLKDMNFLSKCRVHATAASVVFYVPFFREV
jgi:hypothetical protein